MARKRYSDEDVLKLLREIEMKLTARIVALLVERVDIGVDCLNVRLRVDGLRGLTREMLAGDIETAA